MKINILFVIHFYFGKDRFNFGTYWFGLFMGISTPYGLFNVEIGLIYKWLLS